MDYPELYRELAKEILSVDGKIGADTDAFVQRFIAALPADKAELGKEAQAELSAYLATMQNTLRAGIITASWICLGKAGSLQSKEVLALAEQAFTERWADDMTLSKRLWNWQSLTEEGVGQMLQQGIKTGKASGSLIYDMQRMLEFDQAKQFAMVSNNRNQWTTELTNAAKTLIHNPASNQQWQYTLKNVERYIDKLAVTGTRHAGLQLVSQIKSAVAKGNAELVDKSLDWWLYDKQLYNLRRIARTEMATAAHRAVISSTEHDDSIIGYQWRLSSGHKVADICDYYANIDQGLGKGVWRKDSVPRHKAHPHCMCLLVPRVNPIKQRGSENYAGFLDKLNDKQREQILPKWAGEIIGNGTPLKSLLNKEGTGLISKADYQQLLAKGGQRSIF
jgi:hypothetical protein